MLTLILILILMLILILILILTLGQCGRGMGRGSPSFPSFFFLFFFPFFFHLTYSRWTSSLPSCLCGHLRIVPSLDGSRLTSFYRDASSAILQLVNQWLNFTYSRSHAFRYGRKNINPTHGKNRTHDFRTSRGAGYLLDHSGDGTKIVLRTLVSLVRTV